MLQQPTSEYDNRAEIARIHGDYWRNRSRQHNMNQHPVSTGGTGVLGQFGLVERPIRAANDSVKERSAL